VSARALELAYRYLNRRERTVAETRRHLIGRGADVGEAEAAIRELTEQGYLDDARFVRVFAEDKRELEQWGTQRIERALLLRGIDRELVAGALGAGEIGGEAEAGDQERALALLGRRFPEPPRGRRERDRALGVLLRKGYDPELALDALSAYLREPR
jgi:regulatory protein